MTSKQYGRLTLGGYEFQMKDCDMTKFFIFDNDEDIDNERDVITKTVSMEVCFEKGHFGNEVVSPQLIINEFPTGQSEVDDIIGMEFEVKLPEEAYEREDSLYIYEHEPLMNYKWKIIGISDGLIHVLISGTAVTDGYSKPVQTADFDGKFMLRI
jgi:hypothetical protein